MTGSQLLNEILDFVNEKTQTYLAELPLCEMASLTESQALGTAAAEAAGRAVFAASTPTPWPTSSVRCPGLRPQACGPWSAPRARCPRTRRLRRQRGTSVIKWVVPQACGFR